MTPRPTARTRRTAVALLLASAGLVATAGCDPRTLLYFLQPNDPTIPPPKDSPSLRGKRVVVVANAASGAQGDHLSVDRQLVREFVGILRSKVKRIDIVSQEKVWDWVEGHPQWTDPAEVAKAFEADYAIFLELEHFEVQHPGDLGGLLHGAAKTHIQVAEFDHPKNSRGKPITDQPKESRIVYDQYQDSEFPTRGQMESSSSLSREVFKNKFVQVVAAECSWHFVEHAPDDNIQDTRFK